MSKTDLKQLSETRLKNKGLNLTANNLYWFNAIVKAIEVEIGHKLTDSEKGFLLMDVQGR